MEAPLSVRLFDEKGYGGDVLEEDAGRGRGGTGDRDRVALRGEVLGIGCADAVSAAGGEEKCEAEKSQSAEFRCDGIDASAKGEHSNGE